MKKEFTKFIRYEDRSGYIVAIMGGGIKDGVISKKGLKDRLENLKRQKLPFDQTLYALNNYPGGNK